jgi:hypothetical protein
MKVCFQADADCKQNIVRALRRRAPAIDFQTAHEARLHGVDDEMVLARARFLTPIMAERWGGKPIMAAALLRQGLTVLVLFGAYGVWTLYRCGCDGGAPSCRSAVATQRATARCSACQVGTVANARRKQPS